MRSLSNIRAARSLAAYALCVALVSSLGACAVDGPVPTATFPKVHLAANAGQINDAVIEFGGLKRPIKYYVPKNFDARAKHPLILVLHGFNQPIARLIDVYHPMLHKADRDGTLLIFPISTGAPEKQTLAWNVGYGSLVNTKYPETAQVDDVAYLGHVLDLFIGSLNGDDQRLYVTGMSMGGAMAYALSGHVAGRLAAIAPVIMMMGPKLAREFAQAKPLPLLIITGTADPLIKYDGIPGDPQKDPLPVLSNDDNIAYWKARNRIDGEPVVSNMPDPVIEVFKGSPQPSHVVRHAWASASGNELIWMKVVNGGHWLPMWADGKAVDPANLGGRDASFLGNYNTDWDAAGDIYDFLLRHKRKQ